MQPTLIEDQEDSSKISLHAITGTPNPKTMRMIERIESKEVVILVDMGSTYNFLNPAIVTKVGLPLQHNKRIKVKIANEDSMFCDGKCDKVIVRVQGYTFTIGFYTLTLGGCDVILGVNWLKELGPILWDFCQLIMAFEMEGKKVKLRGLHPKE